MLWKGKYVKITEWYALLHYATFYTINQMGRIYNGFYTIAHLLAVVYLVSIKWFAALSKSSNTFCFSARHPALCQVSPYSLE